MKRGEVLSRLAEEQRIRPARVGQVQFLRLAEPLAAGWPVVPGTLLVAWSADLTQLSSIQDLADARAAVELAQALNRVPTIATERIDARGDIFDHVDAIGELRYEGRPIVAGATTPPWTTPAFDRTALAFAGGSLDPDQFSTSSYVLPQAPPLNFLVIDNPARQDGDELRILRALSAEQVGLGIHPANTLVVGAVAGAVATAVVGHYTDKATDKVDKDVTQWARNRQREQQREQREAQAQWKLQQAAARAQYRNASIVATDDPVVAPEQVPGTLTELLAARRTMLGLVLRDAVDDQ